MITDRLSAGDYKPNFFFELAMIDTFCKCTLAEKRILQFIYIYKCKSIF